ncbi:MAG: winged helix-turn-helix domain-containing protein [Acidobacteriota bacterium]
MAPGDILAFGPFQFDTRTKRLSRDSEPVVLSARQIELLHLFLLKAGQVLSKDTLIEAAWQDVAVTDNSVEQAISGLRRALTVAAGQRYIETLARRGYRFAAEVTRVERRETNEALDALLAPHRAWIEGRAALETLEHDQIVHARAVFSGVLTHVPHQASAHVGLANACAMQFEMTRSDPVPDADALATALHHATEACRLDPQYGEAWVTLGFVLERTGNHADALAASRRAVALEADNWRHRLRLSYASWGEERLREAQRALALLPGFPLAHWLAASVHVARQALPEAERELMAGLAAQRGPHATAPRFSGVALHWLLGLIHLARGDEPRALEEFDRELSNEGSGHLYARECSANTWYAIGALKMRQGNLIAAGEAFEQAMARVAMHPMARVGLAAVNALLHPAAAVLAAGPIDRERNAVSVSVDFAFSRAAQLVLSGAPGEASVLVHEALANAPPGSAGWLLPIEPILRALDDPGLWGPALSRVRNRAA